MSSKSDYLQEHLDRIRLYFEWNDETIKLQVYDKDRCQDDDFCITMSVADCEHLMLGLKKAIEDNK